jgi:hypothetical protein
MMRVRLTGLKTNEYRPLIAGTCAKFEANDNAIGI